MVLFAIAVATLAGRVASAVDEPRLTVPLRIVQILDNGGAAELAGQVRQVMTPETARAQVAAINVLFAPAHIRFILSKDGFETRRDDFLNLDSDRPEQLIVNSPITSRPTALGADRHTVALLRLADETPDRITLIVHRGSEWRWNREQQVWEFGVGFSRSGGMIAPKKAPYARIAATEPRVWAHELGHLLGLPHTSRDSVDAPSRLVTDDDISAACADFLAGGGDPTHPEWAIDGDVESGVLDTPPDPGLSFWAGTKDVTRAIELKLRDRPPLRITVSRNNLMAARADHGGFTPGQISVMRGRLTAWLNEFGRVPSPAGAR